MLPAGARAGRGWDFSRAAAFKGVSGQGHVPASPTGRKISRGPHRAAPDRPPAGGEAVGPTITWRSGVLVVLPEWRYPWWEGTGLPRVWGRPFPQVNQEHPHPGHRPPGPRALQGLPHLGRFGGAVKREKQQPLTRPIASRRRKHEARLPSPTSTCCRGCSATITLVSCPRAPPPFAAPTFAFRLPPALPRSAFRLPGTLRAVCFLCGPSSATFGAARSPPRRVARPSALPGVWRSPCAPLSQVTGKGRAASCQSPTWGWGSPCPFYPPVCHPGDIRHHQGEWLGAVPSRHEH